MTNQGFLFLGKLFALELLEIMYEEKEENLSNSSNTQSNSVFSFVKRNGVKFKENHFSMTSTCYPKLLELKCGLKLSPRILFFLKFIKIGEVLEQNEYGDQGVGREEIPTDLEKSFSIENYGIKEIFSSFLKTY